MKSIFVLLALAASTSAFAAEVTLLTVGPNSELFGAFGHSAIKIDGDVYEFMGPSPEIILAKGLPIANMAMLLDSNINVPVVKTTYDAFKYPYIRRRASCRPITKDKLNLTAAQITALKKKLDDAAKAGTYKYGNFTKNCATSIRDSIFGVLPAASASSLKRNGETTYRAALEQSIENAVKSNSGQSVKFPINVFARGQGAAMVRTSLTEKGIPLEFTTGSDMTKAINGLSAYVKEFAEPFNEIVAQLNSKDAKKVKDAEGSLAFMSGITKIKKEELLAVPTLSRALDKFVASGEIDKKRNNYDAMITPLRVRDALKSVKNGRQALIDESKAEVENCVLN